MQASTLFSSESSLNPLAGFPGENGYSAITPLLDLALTEANAQGAYLYSVDPQKAEARLLLWSGLSPIASTTPLELRGRDVRNAFSRTAPLVVHENAWEHPSLAPLAEFRKNRLEGAVSIPLLEAGQAVAFLNVCRSGRLPVKPREFSFLLSLGIPVGALLAASMARRNLEREVERLTQQLADRKLLDRAKGLIQARFDWTEEQAYFCIRNLSRRTRTPMREIAQEVIESGASQISHEELGR
ncbi:MAG TPA: ANTAR domain-containing protein [Bryobacteraceae bacterium]|jgi:GAF domain-containing protein|nr:ANTAR domain-containing protein [Bryobacteraceae bacterium]